MSDEPEPERTTATTKHAVSSRTSDELRTFVVDFLAGKIFCSEQIQPHDMPNLIGMIFMPIALGGLANVDPHTIGCIYEYLSEAGPRSVNGYPCFFSCHLMNTDDWKRCHEAIIREQDRLKGITV